MSGGRTKIQTARQLYHLISCARLILLLGLMQSAVSGQAVVRHGLVADETGAPIAGAKITLWTAQGSLLREMVTTPEGAFIIPELPVGSYVLAVDAENFQARRVSLSVTPADSTCITIVLSPAQLREEVTVTARRGGAVDVEDAAQVIIVRDQAEIRERPLVTIGNALEDSPGIMVQQSTYGQVSPFLRGLTGYHVLNLIDGIRFNNSTFRSGPNQYLAFVEPSQAQRVEALLGPAGAEYGSDSLGGVIHLLTPEPKFHGGEGPAFHGDVQAFASSADLAGGSALRLSLGSRRLAWIVGGELRRHNDVRAGGGTDSRHVFRRFFGLTSDRIEKLYGNRLQDTGFAQYGWHTKLAASLAHDQNLTLWYQRGDLDRVRGYKDSWGGLGRLRSDFGPQRLQLFYARYEKLRLGPLDSLTGTFSVNSQLDGTARQGLFATDTITEDENRVNAFGYAAQATTHLGRHQTIVLGGEVYDEHIDSIRVQIDPVSKISSQRRALYPNGSRYTTYGLFAQETAEFVNGRLRVIFGGRFTNVRFETFADRNRDSAGGNLGVADASQSFRDLTFNTSVAWKVNQALGLNFLIGRGFRAPNLNDLGALGLNDLGFEVPAAAAVPFGGLIGASDGEGVESLGRRVSELTAERLFNYEFGVTVRRHRFYARAHVFDAEFKDPIVRRTLLFPVDSVPAMLSGVPVTRLAPTAAQQAQGVVSVATGLDPRAVKAFVNDGQARYYGVESLFSHAITSRLSAEGNYTYLVGRELNPNRFVRRLPPQQGFLALRYQPVGSRYWVELSGNLIGRQERLSGGDLTDERIGAARRRRDITDFFLSDSVSLFIQAGPDGLKGTADDVFTPTGETVGQILDRVLPIGAMINGVPVTGEDSRVPLYLTNPGFFSMNARGGLRVDERTTINVGVMNLLDRNYRVHGSGTDMPGINFYAGLKYSF
ncbi:MAG: TonB-dependent receptor [Blastocatellia bacterium]|nr:TonB-dependent receptor [Blastocatellia bacterium]